jgi:serine/threonine protein kinase
MLAIRPMHLLDFELLSFIGRGGYGDVWLARDAAGRHWAVKIVYRSSFEDDRPFEREYKGILRFFPVSAQSESQLRVMHVGRRDADGCFYYIMELADDASAAGEIRPDSYSPHTLRSELKSRRRIPATEVSGLAWGLTSALENLHANGLVHRDIKPGNIIFVGGRPKLADVGLVTDADLTRTYAGTEGYIPPEGPGTYRADIYSLGMTLYEACTGCDRRQFPALPENVAELPDHAELLRLIRVINRACQPDRRKRYQSAGEMRGDLERLLRGGAAATGFSLWKMMIGFAAAGVVATGMVFAWHGRTHTSGSNPTTVDNASVSFGGLATNLATTQPRVTEVVNPAELSPVSPAPRVDASAVPERAESVENRSSNGSSNAVVQVPRVSRPRPVAVIVQQINPYEQRVNELSNRLNQAKRDYDKAYSERARLEKDYTRGRRRKKLEIADQVEQARVRERRLASELKKLQSDYGEASRQWTVMQRGQLTR